MQVTRCCVVPYAGCTDRPTDSAVWSLHNEFGSSEQRQALRQNPTEHILTVESNQTAELQTKIFKPKKNRFRITLKIHRPVGFRNWIKMANPSPNENYFVWNPGNVASCFRYIFNPLWSSKSVEYVVICWRCRTSVMAVDALLMVLLLTRKLITVDDFRSACIRTATMGSTIYVSHNTQKKLPPGWSRCFPVFNIRSEILYICH